MKRKYKVAPNGFGNYNIKSSNSVIAMHMTKHMAYKIKSALEQYKPIKPEPILNSCWDCVYGNTKADAKPCNKCFCLNNGDKSYFQPKEKK